MLDEVSADRVLSAGFDAEATEAARRTVESFRAFIEAHRDEITALQIIYSIPRHFPHPRPLPRGEGEARQIVVRATRWVALMRQVAPTIIVR